MKKTMTLGLLIFNTAARLRHHTGNGVAPGGVVGGLLVFRGCAGGPVGFNENEPGGIILLLEEVELRDAGFLPAGAAVGERGGLEGFHAVGFHVDGNEGDEHGGEFSNPARAPQF